MKATLFFLLIFVLPTLPAFGGLPVHTHDTTKLRKIIVKYNAPKYIKTVNKKRKKNEDIVRPYYTLEGDTLFKELTAKNLLKDIQIKKYQKQLRKVQRRSFWGNFWSMAFAFVLPLLILPSAILIAIFAKLVVWQRLLVIGGGLLLIIVSFTLGLGFAFANMKPERDFEYIIRQYNEEISTKKEQ